MHENFIVDYAMLYYAMLCYVDYAILSYISFYECLFIEETSPLLTYWKYLYSSCLDNEKW